MNACRHAMYHTWVFNLYTCTPGSLTPLWVDALLWCSWDVMWTPAGCCSMHVTSLKLPEFHWKPAPFQSLTLTSTTLHPKLLLAGSCPTSVAGPVGPGPACAALAKCDPLCRLHLSMWRPDRQHSHSLSAGLT